MDKNFVFAIDCDEVLRQTLDAMVDLYNKHFNGNKTRDDVKDFVCENSFPDIQPATGMTASQWFFQEHSKELFFETKPFPDIKEDIERLRKYGRVLIITYQKSYVNKIDTLRWLEAQGIECDGICFVKDKALVNADYLVDDNDWNFRCSGVKNAIVVNAPYNKDVPDDQILQSSAFINTVNRVDSLHEFVDKFERAVQDIEEVEKEYRTDISYKLKSQVPYYDSTVYHKQRYFGQTGDHVKIVNTYIGGLNSYVTLDLCRAWGSISVKAKDLKKYI